jgi:hypothetical protein
MRRAIDVQVCDAARHVLLISLLASSHLTPIPPPTARRRSLSAYPSAGTACSSRTAWYSFYARHHEGRATSWPTRSAPWRCRCRDEGRRSASQPHHQVGGHAAGQAERGGDLLVKTKGYSGSFAVTLLKEMLMLREAHSGHTGSLGSRVTAGRR